MGVCCISVFIPEYLLLSTPFVTARVRTNKPHHPRLSIVRLTVVRLTIVRLSVVRLSVSGLSVRGLSVRGLSISGLGGRRSRRSRRSRRNGGSRGRRRRNVSVGAQELSPRQRLRGDGIHLAGHHLRARSRTAQRSGRRLLKQVRSSGHANGGILIRRVRRIRVIAECVRGLIYSSDNRRTVLRPSPSLAPP